MRRWSVDSCDWSRDAGPGPELLVPWQGRSTVLLKGLDRLGEEFDAGSGSSFGREMEVTAVSPPGCQPCRCRAVPCRLRRGAGCLQRPAAAVELKLVGQVSGSCTGCT